MRYKVWSILIIAILLIVGYVNFNVVGDNISDFIGYSKEYILIGLLIYIVNEAFPHLVTRCLLTALAFYYIFEFSMDVLEIFNDNLHTLLYKKKYINYSVALGVCVALIIPLIKKLRK